MIIFSLLLLVLGGISVYCDSSSTCCKCDVSIAYLNTAIEMISKVKYNNSACEECFAKQKVFDCSDILEMGHNTSGVYKIWLQNRETGEKEISVYCDMETDGGGWTVIQRRGNFGRSNDFFYKDWINYKEGFGNLEKDFWLGNDNIFAITNLKPHSARFDLEDFDQNKRFALYDTFWIDGESNLYNLHISDYSGNAGDSMKYHYRNRFSTKDRDNDKKDKESCAQEKKGAWWYNSCYMSNLNGLYYNKLTTGTKDGINWLEWPSDKQSLKWTEIKIRPKKCSPSLVSGIAQVDV